MSTNSQEGGECEFCDEVRLAGTAATRNVLLNGQLSTYSRLIRRTSVVDVLAGLGSLVQGYLLVVPRRHVDSVGELSLAEMDEVMRDCGEMSHRIVETFGGEVAMVEHGSSGETAGSGACITHAHVHLMPISGRSQIEEFMCPGMHPINDLEPLRQSAARSESYYLVGDGHSALFFTEGPELPSQFARRQWARLLGREAEYDWAVVPELTNARLTVEKLRRDSLSDTGRKNPDRALSETVHAYDQAAEWYSERTKAFPRGSTLPGEIMSMAAGTVGVILDAGCGGGRDALYFASLNRQVVALDASHELLSLIPPNSRIASQVGDIRRLPLANESVGAVWCSAVLLHLDRDGVKSALSEFRRVLRHPGMLQISVKEGRGEITTSIPGMGLLRRHFYFYEESDLRRMAEEVGLVHVKSWHEDEEDTAGEAQRWVKLLLRTAE